MTSELTDLERRVFKALKGDFEHYASRCLVIRTKDGDIRPFTLNKAQRYLHDRLTRQKEKTGRVRALILKGRQQGCCLVPDTRVLTSSLEWKQLRDISIGENLIACDEMPTGGKGGCRKMRTATVEKIWAVTKPGYRITLDDGRTVECSGNHRWLSRKSNVQPQWRTVDGTGNGLNALAPGDLLRTVTDEWGESSLEDYWYGGMIDGEGTIDYVNRTGIRFAVSQRDGPVFDRMDRYLQSRHYAYHNIIDTRTKSNDAASLGNVHVNALNVANISDALRLIGLTRPTRFVGVEWWEGKRMPDDCWREIVSIEPIGDVDMIDIQTSTQTFIANGIVSHNSTYVGGRFYWLTTQQKGFKCFILAHMADATDNLFKMVRRYHEHLPDIVKPSTSTTNRKELVFDKLDAGYALGTAGSPDVGRSDTIQLFHGSECAFWQATDGIVTGVMQTIPNSRGTEIILESTANGIGNFFHSQWVQAEGGDGEYEAIFIPWFWQDEYATELPDEFKATAEELELADAFGLSDEQIYWRRNKIVSFMGDGTDGLWKFRQEYPCTSAEAFQTSGEDSLIKPEMVMRARHCKVPKQVAANIIGVDPARYGRDRTSIVWRRGREMYDIKYYSKRDTMEVAGICATILRNEKVDRMFIDVGGLGAGVVDRLRELGYGHIIAGINFGERALKSEQYVNKRAEMWGEMSNWLREQPVSIPDNDELHADLIGPQYTYDSAGRLKLESKEDMMKRGLRSPDGADALALTFSYPVACPGIEASVPYVNHSFDPMEV